MGGEVGRGRQEGLSMEGGEGGGARTTGMHLACLGWDGEG